MQMLHDPAIRTSIETRLSKLRPDAPRQWGTMTVDQMLWHLTLFLEASLGEGNLPVQKAPLPAPVMRFMLLYMPWPKSSPTNKGAVAKETYDFEEQRARCRTLIERFVARPIDGEWPADPTFGAGGGKFASRLQARHFDHHLRQFGA